MHRKKFTIIGLGLIGGSLARALHTRLGATDITAVNPDMAPISEAIRDGCVTRGFTSINEEVLDSDIIFICTPVKAALNYVNLLAGKVKPGCIVTDVGSTKAEIIKHVNEMVNPPCFVGGHPMAGTEKAGYSASFAHLFENAYYILSPSKSTNEIAVSALTGIIRSIGALPVVMEADIHDMVTGSISHVPHVIASALVNLVRLTDSPERNMQMLAAGGFRDITRIASSNPEIWESIVLSNKAQICEILDNYTGLLKSFREYIINDDSESIYSFFETAKIYRDSFSNTRKGLIVPNFEVIVDVEDRPGMIGEIATILGCSGVNIKNINVSNSRELENGCLIITLPDRESVNIAFDLLTSRSYKVYKNS